MSCGFNILKFLKIGVVCSWNPQKVIILTQLFWRMKILIIFFWDYGTKFLNHIKRTTEKDYSILNSKFLLECERILLVLLSWVEFFTRTSIWLFQEKVSSTSVPRYMTDFARVSKWPFSLMLDNVKFSLLMGLKSNNFVFDSFRESLFALSQSVTNFTSLLMTSDITERFLLPYNKLVLTAKRWKIDFSRALVRSLNQKNQRS